MDNLRHNNGFATRDELQVVRSLDVLELSQTEFKFVVDARNGMLARSRLNCLRAAAARQAAARDGASS